MALTLQLFGVLAIYRDHARVYRPRVRKSYWLLALLALRCDRDTDRSFLAGTFWPDVEESQALFYLRRSLTELRQELGPYAEQLTSPTARSLRLNPDGMDIDVRAFDAAIRRGDSVSLETAVNLYRGDLLEGCDEPWAAPEREARREAYLAALQRLATAKREVGDLMAAIAHLRRAANTDPLNESVQRALMEALMQSGDFALVQKGYREFRLRLREGIQSDPSPETTTLYQRIRERAQQASASRVVVKAAAPVEQERGATTMAAPPPTNLPRQLTSFIGRERERAEVKRLLRTGPLVTLMGTGGSGKTRLSLEVAAELLPDYPDGVWLVELASLSDPALVVQTVAATLGVWAEVGVPLLQSLLRSLKERSLLLVMDNCEHLVAACADLVAALLSACPRVSVLTSSREALGITGEQRFQVPSLAIPASDMSLSREQLLQYEAVLLFVERALLVRPDFVVTPGNAPALAAVCRRLDGLPLALELAAVRVRALGVEAIHERLDDRFRLLIGGSKTALPRQQTLRALIDWSYELLNEAERRLLARLSVFAGGWTLEAAEQVCSDPLPAAPYPLLPDSEVLDLLMSLADKSLVLVEQRGETTRYRLLETVRVYAGERLEAAGETEWTRARLRQWCVEFIERMAPGLSGAEAALRLDQVEAEHDNLRLALAAANDALSFRIAVAAWWFWNVRGYWNEGKGHLTRLLEANDTGVGRTVARAKALQGAGVLTYRVGDYAAAQTFYVGSLEIFREVGHRRGAAQALGNLGNIALDQGDYETARALFEESLEICREINDRRNIARSLSNLGRIITNQSDYETARTLFEESLEIYREIGDRRGMALALNVMGVIAIRQGDLDTARERYMESLEIHRGVGDRSNVALMLNNLGDVTRQRGDFDAARPLFEESLEICREIGYREGTALATVNLGLLAKVQGDLRAAWTLLQEGLRTYSESRLRFGIAFTLEDIAALRVAQGDIEMAARLWGTAEALREQMNAPLSPVERPARSRLVGEARSAVGAEAFDTAWHDGRSTPWEQAVERVLTGS
jgi:predicted ATPase/DNA-binding SARP family transcriptional activator